MLDSVTILHLGKFCFHGVLFASNLLQTFLELIVQTLFLAPEDCGAQVPPSPRGRKFRWYFYRVWIGTICIDLHILSYYIIQLWYNITPHVPWKMSDSSRDADSWSILDVFASCQRRTSAAVLKPWSVSASIIIWWSLYIILKHSHYPNRIIVLYK